MDYVKLSRLVSYILRHHPEEYGLTLDDQGFVKVSDLLSSINRKDTFDREITKEDLEYIIAHSDKARHEIQGDNIRALYGHSFSKPLTLTEIVPPAILYHGTTHRALSSILSEGLIPMERQKVCLSLDRDTAIQVGIRRESKPVLLEIDALDAHHSGVRFYQGNDKVIQSDPIPPQFIKVLEK